MNLSIEPAFRSPTSPALRGLGSLVLGACLIAATGCPSSGEGEDVDGSTGGSGDESDTGQETAASGETSGPAGSSSGDTTSPGSSTDPVPETETDSGSETESGTDSGGTGLACVDAMLGSGQPVTAMGTNEGAGDEHSPSCGGAGASGEDVVFEYTPTQTGYYAIDTFGSEVDTLLAVLDGCDGSELPFGCNDDWWEGTSDSWVGVYLEADNTYPVVVDAAGGEVGNVTVNATFAGEQGLPPVACDEVPHDDLELCDADPTDVGTSGTLRCDGTWWNHDIYEFEATAGDCIYLFMDNIAGAPTGEDAPDPWLLVFDAAGNHYFMDEEVDCTDPTYGGERRCPGGGVTPAADGPVTVLVTQYSGEGCPQDGPYTLHAAINGVAVDLAAGLTADDAVGFCPPQ